MRVPNAMHKRKAVWEALSRAQKVRIAEYCRTAEPENPGGVELQWEQQDAHVGHQWEQQYDHDEPEQQDGDDSDDHEEQQDGDDSDDHEEPEQQEGDDSDDHDDHEDELEDSYQFQED